jgi:hypothetical protein
MATMGGLFHEGVRAAAHHSIHGTVCQRGKLNPMFWGTWGNQLKRPQFNPTTHLTKKGRKLHMSAKDV